MMQQYATKDLRSKTRHSNFNAKENDNSMICGAKDSSKVLILVSQKRISLDEIGNGLIRHVYLHHTSKGIGIHLREFGDM